LNGHSGSDFNQDKLINIIFGSEFFLVLVHNLVCTEPNTVVMQLEREDMINEWLALGVVLWCIENLEKKFLHETEMGRLVEALIK